MGRRMVAIAWRAPCLPVALLIEAHKPFVASFAALRTFRTISIEYLDQPLLFGHAVGRAFAAARHTIRFGTHFYIAWPAVFDALRSQLATIGALWTGHERGEQRRTEMNAAPCGIIQCGGHGRIGRHTERYVEHIYLAKHTIGGNCGCEGRDQPSNKANSVNINLPNGGDSFESLCAGLMTTIFCHTFHTHHFIRSILYSLSICIRLLNASCQQHSVLYRRRTASPWLARITERYRLAIHVCLRLRRICVGRTRHSTDEEQHSTLIAGEACCVIDLRRLPNRF